MVPTYFVLIFFINVGLPFNVAVEVPEKDVGELLSSPAVQASRLVYQNFTKGVYTVPGYTGYERQDGSDPPFDPSPECGDRFMNLTEGSFGTITSPNYPDYYPPSTQCEWIIESIPGTVVEATFYDIVTQPWLFGFHDYIMVSSTGSWQEYRRFAGDANNKLPYTIVSKENRLAIRFVSSQWLNFRGFKMVYVVRGMKASDESPSTDELGSAYNNDLIAVCNSKPISPDRVNAKYQAQAAYDRLTKDVEERIARNVRVVNGVETLPHQYPFMAIILTNQGAFCAGSLIDPQHVLTAAHCLELPGANDELEGIDIAFGVYNLSSRAENLYARQYRRIDYPEIGSNVFVHPHYSRRSGANDIAIIRINKLKITRYVQPVFLPSVYTESNPFNGWQLKTLGWGSVDANAKTLSPALRQAAANVIPIRQCREEYSGSATGMHICTKNPVSRPISPNATTELPPVMSSTEIPSNSSEIPESSTVEGDGLNSTTTSSPEDEANSVDAAMSENENNDAIIEYESPCHGDNGGPLIAQFLENYSDVPDHNVDPNNAGSSSHECVNARQNELSDASLPMKKPIETACHRPKDMNAKWWVQVGILSFGSRVCGRKTPVVYTRVTAHLEWISYITGRHG